MSLLREITERYRLEKILRSTRSGSVLRATDALGGGTAVVKLVALGADPAGEGARFSAFASRLAGLEHRSLPVFRDFGLTTDGSAFLVMEHLEGPSAAELAGTDPKRIVAAMVPIVEGLALLAEHGIGHGNLSPDNLLFATATGEIKMLGLGTALLRAAGPAAGGENARFRAPEELAAGAGPAEPGRADVYSFAATLCALLEVPLPAGAPDEAEPADAAAGRELSIPLSLAFQLEDAEPLRRFLAAALDRRPAARPTFAAAREAAERALHAAPAAAASVEETRPFLPESLEPSIAAAAEPPPPSLDAAAEPPAPILLAASDRLPALAPARGNDLLAELAAALEADIAEAPAAPPHAVPPAIPAAAAPPSAAPPTAPAAPAIPPPPEPVRLAIPEPPRIAIPEPLQKTPPEAPRLAIPEAPKPAVPPPAAALDDDGEALSPITDDMLAAMIAAPPKPAAKAAPARGAKAAGYGVATPSGQHAVPGAASGQPSGQPADQAGAAPGGQPAAWKARLLKPLPLAAAAGILLLIVAGLVLALRRATPAAAAAPPPAAATAAAPGPPPLPPPADRLRTAEEELAAGNDHAALVALRTITPAEQRTLPATACRQIQDLEGILALTAPARLAGDLESGWKTGNLELLRTAARDAADQPAAAAVLPAAARDTLERARRASDLYALAEAAARRGDNPGALQQFGALAHLVPSLHDGSGLRERAAAAVEAEAAKRVADARYEEALAQLDPLRQSWPDRPGLKAEVETIRDQEKNEQTLANLLAQADNAEKRRRPDEGIDLLKKVKPTPHLAAEYSAQMARLQALLDRVDARAPTVELRDGFLLEYDRGTVVNLSFRIRDDYKVENVKVYARPAGGRMVEMPFKHDGFVYDVEVQPSFHQNGTVEVYVVATDYSGHETSLGSREKPLQLKRRKGFRET